MALASGTRLGAYEILALIGAGGMGRVYRARDTKLDRDVAVKVLPEEFASDSERLARFEREARLLASLNHPNIASIHGFEEPNALVLELVEGPTLAERIEQEPIPVDEAIAIAKQIADALEAGHEAGVIHRDLKPANIKLKEDGTVKVLDYGLAKALEGETPSGVSSDLSQSPTLTRQGTQTGVILGTASYMSPEQAKGRRVDRRADIWAFGAVLYEMLAGRRAFEGEDVSDTLAYVLTKEPEWEALPANTPVALRQVLRVCLTKDPKERVRDIADVRLAMTGAFALPAAPRETVVQPAGWRSTVAGALILGVITGVVGWNLKPEAPRPVARFSLPFPPGVSLTGTSFYHAVALSPDGTRLVYSANDVLYLRVMDRTEATPIRGTEGGASNPFFSPDGEWVGFWAADELKKISIHGGAAVSLCETGSPWGARWEADDTIVFGQPDGILRVSADGGTPEVLVAVDGTEEVAHGPQVLRRGRDLLFTLGDGANWDEAQIVVQSLESGERKVLIEGGRDARYVPTGHLIYVLDGTLLAVPFDEDALEVTAGPAIMEEDVATGGVTTGAAHFSVSDTGSLVYVPDSALGLNRTLVWVDRGGREEALAAEPSTYAFPRISPDGSRLAVTLTGLADIWTWDFTRETLTRFTFHPPADGRPVWTPDGQWIVFESHREGQGNVFAKATRGSGQVERLTESERHQRPLSVSPDGAAVLFEDGLAPRNVSLVPFPGGGDPQPLLHSEFNETNAEIAPDGRWLAYQSDKSGQNEVYVRPFPDINEREWQVSRDGGEQPLWAPNGRELFYATREGQLMAVSVQSGNGIRFGNPETAVSGPYLRGTESSRNYDVSPDGERFLMIKEGGSDRSTSPEIILVQNWFEELKRMVPAQ